MTTQNPPLHPAIPTIYAEKHKSRLPYSRLRPMTPQGSRGSGHLRSRSSPASTNNSYSPTYFVSSLASPNSTIEENFGGLSSDGADLASSTSISFDFTSPSFGFRGFEEEDLRRLPTSISNENENDTPRDDENTLPFPLTLPPIPHTPPPTLSTPSPPHRHHPVSTNPASPPLQPQFQTTPPKREKEKEKGKGRNKGEGWGVAIYILLSLHVLLVWVGLVAWFGRMGRGEGVGEGCGPVSLVGFLGDDGGRELWEGVEMEEVEGLGEEEEGEERDVVGDSEDVFEIVWA